MKKYKIISSAVIVILVSAFVLPLCGNIAKDNGIVLSANAASTEKSGKCGDNVSWKLDSGGTLTISGSGKMYNYEVEFGSVAAPYYSDKEFIKKINIKKGVTSIGSDAFYDCSNVSSITIPNSVTSIGLRAFGNCDSLTSIAVDSNNKKYSSSDGVLFNKNKTNLIQYPMGNKRTKYSIPNGVTSIGDNAFEHCKSLINVTIPNTVTSIGSGAFCSCENVTNIKIPDSVKKIGNFAFLFCYGLKSISLPSKLTEVPDDMLSGCKSLKSINIPNSVKYIGSSAFSNCTSLKSISIGDKITTIRQWAFGNTAYYNNKKNWNNSVLYIGKYLIQADQSISGEYKIKSGTKCIADVAFYACTKLSKVVIPDGVVGIGEWAFAWCEKLSSIVLGNGIVSIGSNAFDSTALKNNPKNWKNGVLYIGKYLIEMSSSVSGNYKVREGTEFIATGACSYSNLKTITVPISVKSIGVSAFFGCDELTCITIYNKNCSIADLETTIPEKTKIYGLAKSTAQKYAQKYKRTFIEHKHTYDKGKVTKKATCTAAGVKTFTCTICKNTKTTSIAKLKHTHKISITKATLSKDGKIVRNCKECKKAVSTTVIPKIKTVTLSGTSYTYDGKAKTPSVTVKDSKGKTLKKDTDYTVKYASGRKEVGTYTVKITFKGNYSGSKSLTFKIALGKVGGLKQMNDKGINFTWNKVSGATGYQVYTYDAKSKKYILLGTPKGNTLGNSSAKGTMKIRVRAYRKVGKNTYYGTYSNVLTAKAK